MKFPDPNSPAFPFIVGLIKTGMDRRGLNFFDFHDFNRYLEFLMEGKPLEDTAAADHVEGRIPADANTFLGGIFSGTAKPGSGPHNPAATDPATNPVDRHADRLLELGADAVILFYDRGTASHGKPLEVHYGELSTNTTERLKALVAGAVKGLSGDDTEVALLKSERVMFKAVLEAQAVNVLTALQALTDDEDYEDDLEDAINAINDNRDD